jgi:hypothetical protein
VRRRLPQHHHLCQPPQQPPRLPRQRSQTLARASLLLTCSAIQTSIHPLLRWRDCRFAGLQAQAVGSNINFCIWTRQGGSSAASAPLPAWLSCGKLPFLPAQISTKLSQARTYTARVKQSLDSAQQALQQSRRAHEEAESEVRGGVRGRRRHWHKVGPLFTSISHMSQEAGGGRQVVRWAWDGSASMGCQLRMSDWSVGPMTPPQGHWHSAGDLPLLHSGFLAGTRVKFLAARARLRTRRLTRRLSCSRRPRLSGAMSRRWPACRPSWLRRRSSRRRGRAR